MRLAIPSVRRTEFDPSRVRVTSLGVLAGSRSVTGGVFYPRTRDTKLEVDEDDDDDDDDDDEEKEEEEKEEAGGYTRRATRAYKHSRHEIR